MNAIHKNFQKQIKIARIFFVISAIYGLSLRLYKVTSFITIDYKRILQAHSHVTFLGWGFLAVISIIGIVYYPEKLKKSIYLKSLFYIMASMLVGMLISFPIQGYKLFSIVFLSVFLIVSYLYLIEVYKVLKEDKSYDSRFIKIGIFYYFLSSLAIWMIAIVTVKYGKTTLYYNSVYFYLHFLYNGFFVFTLFGLFIKYLKQQKIQVGDKQIKYFYLYTHIACVPAYTLSLLWANNSLVVNVFSVLSAALQLVTLLFLYRIVKSFFKQKKSRQVKWMGILIFGSYFLKIILQAVTVFPGMIKITLQLKPYFIVGYLHLFTLGFMSMLIFLLLILLVKVKLSKIGMYIFILGILLSEGLLFLQGGLFLIFKNGITNINLLLLFVSSLMPIGLLLIYFNIDFKQKSKVVV